MMRSAAVCWWLLLAGCAGLPARSADPLTMRVMTYNIHAGRDAQQIDNLHRVAAVIDSAAADIVLLQEVDRRTQRAGGADHFAELRALTGMHGVFGKSLDYQGGEYGIAVLSRWPMDSVATVALVVQPPQERSGRSYEPRVALHVVITTARGPLHVVNTHLDPGGAGTYRKQELIGVLAHMQKTVPEQTPLLMGGDLNARPTTDDIAAVALALRDAFSVCGGGAGETFPARAPDRRIDYIFYRNAHCGQARVVNTEASDHRPLVAVMEIYGR